MAGSRPCGRERLDAPAAGGAYLDPGAYAVNNVPGNFIDVVKFLVEGHGVDVNLPDSSGYTPLHYHTHFRGTGDCCHTSGAPLFEGVYQSETGTIP